MPASSSLCTSTVSVTEYMAGGDLMGAKILVLAAALGTLVIPVVALAIYLARYLEPREVR